MKRLRVRPALAVLTAAGLLFPSPMAPSADAQNQAPGQIRVQVELVNLFASVRDKDRRMLPDLKKEEFHVFEDGKEQKLDFFRSETALPLTIGLLIDTSGSQERVLAAEQSAAMRFFDRVLRSGDMAMIISFDVGVDLLVDFTADRDRLDRAINRVKINAPYARVTPGTVPYSGGGTNMYDAIYLGCQEKLSREAGRKALIILTDAVDTGSKIDMKEALETAQRTDTVLHFIVISAGGYGYGGSGEGVARKMAEETGGRAIAVDSGKELEAAFDQISQELRSQYTLGYYSTNPTRDGKFRKIKVETTRKGTKVLARRGYYAPKG